MAWHSTASNLVSLQVLSSLAYTSTVHTHTIQAVNIASVYRCANGTILRVSFFHSFFLSVFFLLIHSYLLKLTGFYRSLSLYLFIHSILVWHCSVFRCHTVVVVAVTAAAAAAAAVFILLKISFFLVPEIFVSLHIHTYTVPSAHTLARSSTNSHTQLSERLR